MAVRVGHVLGTSLDLWLDIQKRVDLFESAAEARSRGA
jgi:plasmid maintenance system antidote protein VapI